jgi:hypothetical protein
MAAQATRSNRFLMFLMGGLYLVSLGAFTYANMRDDPGNILWIHALNVLILSIPLVLLYGSAYVLITTWREHSLTGQLTPRQAKIIHWAPRLAAILIIFFVTLFSLDVFDTEAAPIEILIGFIVHNIPSIFMILMLVLAWRRPVIGFLAFLLAGLFFLIVFFSLGNVLLFAAPLLLISALFYADWRWLKPQPPAPINTPV